MNLGNNNVNIHMTFELCYEEGITALICQKKFHTNHYNCTVFPQNNLHKAKIVYIMGDCYCSVMQNFHCGQTCVNPEC